MKKSDNTKFWILFVGTVLLAHTWLTAVWIAPTHACSPPLTGWLVDGTFPQDGEEDAPINGVIAVRLQYVEDFSQGYPSEEVILRTVGASLTRGEGEVVEGSLEVYRDLREVRFVTDFPLDEGITYTLELELRHSLLDGDNQLPDETQTFQFTTQDGLDVAPPAFSGLQSLVLTDSEQAVRECCETPPDECLCGFCQWCWTVDWSYPFAAELRFRSVEDEFGSDSITYAVYQLEGPEDTEGELRTIARYRRAEEQLFRFVLPEESQGPWCYRVQAFDVFGRSDNNNTVLCVGEDDFVPRERSEVPPPDYSGCLEPPEPAVEPVAEPMVEPAAEPEDTPAPVGEPQAEPDAPEPELAPTAEPPEPDQEPNTNVSLDDANADDGCGCSTPAAPTPLPWGAAWLLFAGMALVLRSAMRNTEP